MRSGMEPPTLLPHPSKPLWVPFPGSKRKAETSLEDDEYCPPPKQFAIDEEVASTVLENGRLAPDPATVDLEIVEDATLEPEDAEMECPESMYNYAGASTSPSSCQGEGTKHAGAGVAVEGESASSNNRTLVLLEDVREVLSNPPKGGSGILDRLAQQEWQKQSSQTALVLWKPPTAIAPIQDPEESSNTRKRRIGKSEGSESKKTRKISSEEEMEITS